MSNVDGVPTMRRQAVQFKIFAYSNDLTMLGELTQEIMATLGLTGEWTVNIGNRKLLNYGEKGGLSIPAITANGSATGNQITDLQANNPWDPGKKIKLGQITGRGLFIPGSGGVIRKNQNSRIDPYPADEGGDLECTDTTADGSISVKLTGTEITTIPACVVCAPQDHSPDVNALALEAGSSVNSIKPSPQIRGNNLDWTKGMKELLGIAGNVPNNAATEMDNKMIATTNGEYNPGMETSFDFGRTEFQEEDIQKIFFERGINFIGPNEIRPQYKSAATDDQGALPGQLTSGLCSTWQGDLFACLSYWTAEFPQKVLVNGVSKNLFRKDCNSTTQFSSPEEINEFADKMGVARNISTDPTKIEYKETERNC
jgi:hypothetical protein